MPKNRGPSPRNDNERLFMYHGTRQAEKSWRETRRRDTEMVVVAVVMVMAMVVLVPLCRALAQEYMQRANVSPTAFHSRPVSAYLH